MTHRPNLADIQRQMPAKRFTMRFIPKEAQSRVATCKEDAKAYQAVKSAATRGGESLLSLELLRAALCCAKELYSDVAAYVARGEKVLVLTQHHVAVNAIARHFRERGLEPFAVVTGESSQGAERHRIVQSFESHDGGAVILGTGGVLGTGVDFTRVSLVAIAELPYRPIDIVQQMGRGGRIGGVPCEVAFYVAEGTRAERVQGILLAKLPAAQAMAGDGELDEMVVAMTAAGDDDALTEAFFGRLGDDLLDDDRS
jgi:superfamily II DNA/RNA helicase